MAISYDGRLPRWYAQEAVDQVVRERTAKARAEVLAACIKIIKRYSSRYSGMDYSNNTFCACIDLSKQISGLQPAAFDLEELLRQAELKGLKFAEDSLHAVNNPFSWANKLAGRIAELEKARAILEKP